MLEWLADGRWPPLQARFRRTASQVRHFCIRVRADLYGLRKLRIGLQAGGLSALAMTATDTFSWLIKLSSSAQLT